MEADSVIVVGGEALIDLVGGGPEHPNVLNGHPGGGPYNVARTLGRLEQPVAYLGRLSTDRFGRQLRAELEADGVSLRSVVGTDAPTTLALAEIDARGAATYRFYAEGTAAPGLTAEAALAILPERVGAVHVGTLGLVFEPMATAYERVVASLAGSALVVMDLNCRPAAIEDPAGYRARIARLVPSCDVVKASDDDLAWLDPDCPPLETARAMLADGPSVVLLTRGGEGATVVTAEPEQDVPAPDVTVVDTIGAGDAFGGAFLAWWRRRGLDREDLGRVGDIVAATRFACLVAAKTCERAGASPPRLAELGDAVPTAATAGGGGGGGG